MKNVKYNKKMTMLILLFIIILNIFSYSAIVSDNDGSAFVTKAEFESLKNNFSNQLDNYNSSIDEKIDGSIASYLAGINLKKKSTEKVILADWKYVISHNTTIKNVINLPLFSMNYFFFNYKWNTDDWTDLGWGYYRSQLTRADSPYHTICLINGAKITNNDTGTLDISNIYWEGQTKKYSEEISISQSFKNGDHLGANHAAGAEWDYHNFQGVWVEGLFAPTWTSGYKKNLSDKNSPIYQTRELWTIGNIVRKWTTNSLIAYQSTVTLNDEANSDTDYNYKHIISWDKNQTYEVGQIDMNHYANISGYQTKTSESLLNASNARSINRFAFQEAKITTVSPSTSSWYIYNKTLNVTDSLGNPASGATAIEQKLPTCGLLYNSLKAESIYQYKPNSFSQLYDNLPENVKLHQGMPLIYAKEDQDVEWEAKFDLSIESGAAETPTEVYVAFATKPFTNKKENDDFLTVNCGTTKASIVKTTNKNLKIDFTMPKNGTVYIKWWPAFSNDNYIDSIGWESKLKLSECNNVLITK